MSILIAIDDNAVDQYELAKETLRLVGVDLRLSKENAYNLVLDRINNDQISGCFLPNIEQAMEIYYAKLDV